MTKNNSSVIAHIEMMQGIINRMAENSRSCKNWCILVVSAILTFVTMHSALQNQLLLICAMPISMFCFLDSYYLSLEKNIRIAMRVFVYNLNNGRDVDNTIFQVEPGDLDDMDNACNIDKLLVRIVRFIYGMVRAFCSFSVFPFYGCLIVMLYLLNIHLLGPNNPPV